MGAHDDLSGEGEDASGERTSPVAMAKVGFAHGLPLQAWSQNAGRCRGAERREGWWVASRGERRASPPRVGISAG